MQTYFVTAVNYKHKSVYSIAAPVGKILSYAEFQIWHHDPQHNDTYHNDILHNDIQHKGIWQNELWHEDIRHNDIKDITLRIITFSIMKFGITTFGINISSITTLAIIIKNSILCHCVQCCYAESHGTQKIYFYFNIGAYKCITALFPRIQINFEKKIFKHT
jgi:hypothetical protein